MLSPRLDLIAKVFDKDILVDVGADHGFLTIDLLLSKKVSKANLVEVNDGPYRNAVKNLKSHGLSDKVETFLDSGLCPFHSPFNKETGIVIAGMGGKLISDILFNDENIIGDATLFLQPNNGESSLRLKLNEKGFKIIKDLLVEDNNIIYTIIVATRGVQELNNTELELGYNVDSSDSLFKKKYFDELRYLEKTISNIPSDSEKYEIFNSRISMLKETLGEK